MMSKRLVLVVALALSACGGLDSGVEASTGLDAGQEAAADAGDPTTGLDFPKMCDRMRASLASCASSSGAQCEQVLQNAAARGCADYLDDLQSWVVSSSQPYACVTLPGLPPSPAMSAAAPEGAVVGDACAGAVNTSECYSVSCQSYRDCPSGSSCNEVTKHCYSNDAQHCAGLPCASFRDCPSGNTCNTALGVCIRG